MADETKVESKEQSLLDELAHSETVRKLIECPVCLELPLPPIYVCNKGHIVCNNCQARTYACPLCREHYSTTRGFVAEGIIEKCMLRCKFADHGCPLTMRGSVLVDHLKVCDHRPVKCVDCGGKLVNFDEYEDHLLKYHRINGINQSRAYVIYSMNLAHQIAFGEKCCWPQYYLKAFDNVTFLLRLYATHWFVCAWISLLGPKSECAKYEAMLEFHPTNDDSVVHTWQGPVNHFRDDPAKQIFLQGRGLITPMETLMQIAPVANDHAEWLYNIEILQANEKSENDDGGVNDGEENSEESTTSLDTSAEEKAVPAAASVIENGSTVASGENESFNSPAACSCSSRSPSPVANASSSDHKFSVRGPLRMISSETPRVVAGPPSCPPLRTPRHTSTNSASRSIAAASVAANAALHASGSGTNVLTPGPAVMSPSTSLLAQAASVTSVVPTPSSLMENSQTNTNNNASSTLPSASYSNPSSFNNESSQGPIRVSTLRPTARLMNHIRRSTSSPLALFLRGENRAYGFSEDDWNITSDSDPEEEE